MRLLGKSVVAATAAAVLTLGAVALPVATGATWSNGSTAATPSAVVPLPIARTRLTTTLVASGLVAPVLVTSAPDGTGRLFVVEQAGRIRTVLGGTVRGTYLDIRRLVNSGGERGMLGLAFAPDFATSHLLWVTYTRADGALVLARYSVTSTTASTVRASSATTVLVVPHPGHDNHNGGYIGFGPDGYLYLGTGDGGGGGDSPNNAQNVRSLLGKMLRLNVRCAGHLYCSPSTNPYASSATARHEIWMTGLRNPWRWSFDTNGTQWIGDVGQNAYEEINSVPAASAKGRNFGWSCREGLHSYRPERCRTGVTYVSPVLEFCHPDSVSGCAAKRAAEAIIGGFVYRGAAFPASRGTYVLGDYVTGHIWAYRNGVLTPATNLPGVSGFGLDRHRELYAVTLSGGLYRIGFRSS